MPLPDRGEQPSPLRYVVEVLKLRPLVPEVVRLLGYSPLGLLYHWDRPHQRSVYCHGDSCRSPLHKVATFWKGYAPIDVWDASKRLWFPAVLEIAESLDHDLQGTAMRGQLWEVSRAAKKHKKNGKVGGRLLDERGPTALPEAFNVLPILYTLYHDCGVELSVLNPMPPRTVLRATPGEPPRLQDEQPAEGPPTAEDWKKLRELGRLGKNGHSSP